MEQEKQEEDEEEDIIGTPAELLDQIENGDFEPDPLAINYEVKRMIYDPEINCNDFTNLFEALPSILNPRDLFEITQVLYPEFCNWIEILINDSAISTFSTAEFYKLHNEILKDMSKETCNPCIADFDSIWKEFYEEADRRYQEKEFTKSEKFHLTSLLKYHDELGELLVSHSKDNTELANNESEFNKYLQLVNPDKIMDPVLKRSVKELIQEFEW